MMFGNRLNLYIGYDYRIKHIKKFNVKIIVLRKVNVNLN